MNVYYIDVANKGGPSRPWRDYPAADLLREIQPQAPCVVFYHLSDFLFAADDRTAKHSPSKSLVSHISCMRMNGNLYNGQAGIVFYSGDVVVSSDQQSIVKKILYAHPDDQIGFVPGIARGIHIDVLRRRIDPIIESFEKGNSVRASILIAAGPSRDELLAAWTILLKTFALATSESSVVPDSLKTVYSILYDKRFAADYWSPVLVDRRLNPLLVTASKTTPALIAVDGLQSVKTWNDLAAHAVTISTFRNNWFAQVEKDQAK